MNREIKFRGKSITTGEWVYGSLVNNLWKYSEHHSLSGQNVCEIFTGKYNGDSWEDIINDEAALVCVIPETVGQFTGLKDKNIKEIYEGDIVTPCFYKNWKQNGMKMQVIFYEGMFCLQPNKYLVQGYTPLYKALKTAESANNGYEIIGNIYETPDLLTKTN